MKRTKNLIESFSSATDTARPIFVSSLLILLFSLENVISNPWIASIRLQLDDCSMCLRSGTRIDKVAPSHTKVEATELASSHIFPIESQSNLYSVWSWPGC